LLLHAAVVLLIEATQRILVPSLHRGPGFHHFERRCRGFAHSKHQGDAIDGGNGASGAAKALIPAIIGVENGRDKSVAPSDRQQQSSQEDMETNECAVRLLLSLMHQSPPLAVARTLIARYEPQSGLHHKTKTAESIRL
jgi:hypothetical protein